MMARLQWTLRVTFFLTTGTLAQASQAHGAWLTVVERNLRPFGRSRVGRCTAALNTGQLKAERTLYLPPAIHAFLTRSKGGGLNEPGLITNGIRYG